jgi:type I restriction enzyme R subunit
MAIAEWPCGKLWADYALFIGEELVGIVEAKKHNKSVANDLVQAKNYSKQPSLLGDAKLIKHANSNKYKIPFLFATNGRPYLEQFKEASGIWFWDATNQTNIQKPLQNWFTPYDLKEKLKFDKQKGIERLKSSDYNILSDNTGLNLRYYQIEAIKAIEKKIIEHPSEEKALVAMATGTGKTRTIVGLAYRLIASKRFKRILFLVDRTMLGTQAAEAFKEVKIESLQTFAQIYDLQELDSKLPELDTKIHFATVQSMVARIQHDTDAPSVGDYDCIIVDEAHRGYTLDREMDEQELFLYDQQDFQSKYRMVLDYFDAYRIGLTATPATHTAEIFGNPVYHYSYRKAVVDGFLVDFEPPYVFNTKLSEEGIVWNKGDEVFVYDPENTSIVSAGITEDEIDVQIQGFNRRVITESFNKTVLREIIETYGLDPEDPKKTLIFAATTNHADTIVKVLKELYDEVGESVDDDAIVKLVGDTYNRKSLLRNYKNEQYPSIVVTVDLLTTGIDVPSISNLIFLRRVNSRILYDQMIGRATRRADDIGKEVFKIYDCVGVSRIMSEAEAEVMQPVAPNPKKSFVDIVNEIKLIEKEVEVSVKLDRIIAKLQRKIRTLSDDQIDRAGYLSGEGSVPDFVSKLRTLPPNELKEEIDNKSAMWEYLDKEKGKRQGFGVLFSEHEDELREVTRAYGENLKPKDYIESFVDYIKSNINKIEALKIIATKPSSLDRKSLKELRLILDEQGYNKSSLNTAYSDAKLIDTNAEIAADIISHIRTAAIGTELVDHNKRINNAVKKLKLSHKWTSPQIKWIDRIEKQLLKESVIQIEDLNKPPFSDKGGIRKLNKIFKDKTIEIIEELNSYLYA